ncbi:MAG: hypothetical protein ACOYNS_14735, partial [Bacteroidota bacterium]
MNFSLSPSSAVYILLVLLCTAASAQQSGRTAGTEVNDTSTGLFFMTPAPTVKDEAGTYLVNFPVPNGTAIQSAEAEISVGA